MWIFVGDSWTLQWAYTPSGIINPLGLPASRPILEMECGEDTFSPDLEGFVFSEFNYLMQPIHQASDDRDPKVSKEI